MKLREMFIILTLIALTNCKKDLPVTSDICGYHPSLVYFSSKKTYSEKEKITIISDNCHTCEVCFDRLSSDERAVCQDVKELCPKK